MEVVDKGKRSAAAAEWADEDDSDHIEKLVLSIGKLQDIQDELDKVNEEASDKLLEFEQKYNEIRRPVYLRRNLIIQSIPGFWLTVFLSHPVLGDLLTEEDQKIFKYLVSLDVDPKDVKSGYSISFAFSPNPYFEDTKLTKTFSFVDDGTTNVTGTTIKWKEGMELANGDAHEKKGTKRPFAEESFFSWFGETQPKNVSGVITDEVADIIKEDLWPYPLTYFNNDSDEEDDFDGVDDDDEDASKDEDAKEDAE